MYSLVKDDVQVHVEIQKHTWRIQGQLFLPNYAKDPEETKNYNSTPRSFANQQDSNSSLPTVSAGEEVECPYEPEEPHRMLAFVGVAIAKTIGGRTSTGVTPQHVQFLDPTTPSMTAATEGKPGRIQPPNIHSTRSHLCTLEAKESHQPPHQAERETHRPQAPKRISTTSPVKLEQSTTGARKKPGDFIPLRRHRHRLADAARNTMPQRTTPPA